MLLIYSAAQAFASEREVGDAVFEAPIHVDDASLPRWSLTPGDAFQSAKIKDLCAEGSTGAPLPSAALCDEAFDLYGIPPQRRFQYACRYVIPLAIGGASTPENVWPQIAPEAALKDRLDKALQRRVCTDGLSPSRAQREIATDWVDAYRRYVALDDPLPESDSLLPDEPAPNSSRPAASALGAPPPNLTGPGTGPGGRGAGGLIAQSGVEPRPRQNKSPNSAVSVAVGKPGIGPDLPPRRTSAVPKPAVRSAQHGSAGIDRVPSASHPAGRAVPFRLNQAAR